MADNVGYAVLEVTPSLKGISKDLNKQFVGPAQSAGKRAGSMLGDALKGAAKGAGIAAGAVLATSLTKGFQRLTAIEDAEAKLKGLGNSAGDTAKIMDNALAAVKGTAFGMDEAATTAASAVAAGLKPGKDLQNYLGLVGDAATIAGTSMADMGGIFNKVMTSGKVQGDVFAQLGDQGIPVVQMLAETMGVSAEEVYKMGSAGEISSEQFLTAMGKMKGAALEGGNTTTGALKNLYAALGRLGAGLLGGMFPHFKTALNQMTTWVDSLEEKLTPLADTIGQKLGSALGAVVGWLSKLDFSSFQNFANSMGGSGVFDSIGDSLNRLKPAMVAIVGALPELGSAAVEIAAGGIKLLAAGLSFLADHVDTIVKFAPLIVAGFIAWKGASTALAFSTQKLALAQLAMTPALIANNALRLAANFLEYKNAKASATSAVAKASDTAATSGNTAAVAANNTAQSGGLLARVRATAVMAGQRIALIATTAATWASTVATRALGAALRFAMGPIGWIITGVAALAAGLTWFFTKTETGKKVWESLMGALKSAWGWLKDVFAKVWDTISGAAGAAFGFIKDHWQTLLTIFGGPLGIIIAQVSKHWDTIKNAAATAFGWIGDKVGWVVDKIQVFKDILGTIGKAISTIWSSEDGSQMEGAAGNFLGRIFGEGGAEAIVNTINVVKSAFDGFSAALSAAWTNVIQPVLSFIGDAFKVVWDGIVLGAKLVWATLEVGWNFLTIIYENVIKPVLDLIWQAFKFVWDGIVLGAKLVFATLQVGWNFLQIVYDTVISPVLSAIGWVFARLWEGLKLGARVAWAFLEVGWGFLQRVYTNVIQPVLSWIGDRFRDLWNGVKIIAGWIGDKWNWLFNNVISPVAGFIGDAVERVGRGFKRLYDDYVRPVVDWIRDKINFMTDLFTGIKDKVVGALTGAGKWLWDAGKNIVQGLLDGAGSLLSKIGDFFLDKIPGWIKDPFKKALGIHSPSRVFAGFGQNIGQGLIDGIDKMSSKVEKAAEGIGQKAVDAAQGAGDLVFKGDYTSKLSNVGVQEDSAAVDAGLKANQALQSAPQIPAVPVPDPAVATQAWTDAGTGLQTATTTLIDPAVQQVNMGVSQFQTESQNLASTVLPAWNALGAGLATAKTSLFDPVVNGVTNGVRSFGATTAGQLGAVVTPAWNAMAVGVANLKAVVIDPMQAGLRADMGNTAAFTQQQTLGVMVPAWQQTGDSIWAVQNGAIDPALAATRGAVANTQTAFAQGTSGIISEWDRLREGTAAPVRFTIGTVFNSGLVGMWNSVADMIGTKKMAEYPLRFARGGVMPGYTPGRDVHKFVSPTGGALELSGGEAIMRPEWTRAVGGPAAVNRMNRDARSGRVRHRSPKSAYNYTDNRDAFADGGVVQRFANGGIVESMRRTMAARFPMLQLTSGLRFTDNGYHSKGMAADFSNSTGPSTPQMQAAAAWIFRNFRRQTIQLIHHPSPFNIGGGAPAGDGMGYYGAGTMSEHQNHVHWAVNSPVSPDGTGPVPEGFVAGATSVSPEEMLRMFTDEHIKKTEAAIKGYKGSGGFIDELPAKTWDTMRGAAEKKMITAFNEMGGGDPGGEGAERWRPMMIQALMRQGLGHWAKDKSIVDRFIRQIWTESRGNPKATQGGYVDVNTGGNEAEGLGQIAKSTWRSFRDPSLPDDWHNPWSNLNAMARYVRGKYGEHGYMNIGNGIGYDSGGVLKPTPNGFGTYYNHTGKPEAVLTNEQWRNVALLVVNLAKLVDPLRVFAKNTRDVSNDVKTIATNSAKQVRDQVSSAVWAALPSEVKSAMVIADAAGRSWVKVSSLIQGKAEAWARGEWPIGSGRKVKEGVTDDRADFVGWKEVTLDTDLVQVAGWNMLAAQKVANNQMKPGKDPAANAIYDVFGRAPILPDLIRIGSMGPNAIDAATDAAIEAFETGDTARLEEWTHSTSQLTEAIMRTRDATIATGQMVKGFMNGFLNWAMASEEHGRQGSWQEYFAHYGGEYGTKEGDWLLSQFGFGGIVGGKFKDSFANLLIETAQSPLLSAPPILDEEGRVIGTQLQKQQDQAAVSPTVLPESGTSTAVLPEVAPQPVTEAKSQEIQVTVELPEGKSAFTAEEVKGMLAKLDDDVDAIKIEVKGLKNESAAVTSGVSLMV